MMGTLANRLEKLEKDLYMLTAMQHFMADADFGLEVPELPTRDVSVTNNRIPNVRPKAPPRKIVRPSSPPRPPPDSALTADTSNSKEQVEVTLAALQQQHNETLHKLSCAESKLELQEQNFAEAKADLLAKLQQTESQLERENECKNGLLRLTLQMKNQLQQKCKEITDLENNIVTLKSENDKILKDAEVTQKQSEKAVLDTTELVQRLDILKQEKSVLQQTILDLEQKQKEAQRSHDLKVETCLKQEQKLLSQVNQLIAKCSQIDQVRQSAMTEVKRLQEILTNKESEVQKLVEQNSKLESAIERSEVLHQCGMDKLRLDLEAQVAQGNQTISSCYNVLKQTKVTLLKFNAEKTSLQESLQKELKFNQSLQTQLEQKSAEFEALRNAKDLEAETKKSLLHDAQGALEKLKHKNQDFQRTVLKLKLENSKLTKRMISEEEQFDQKFKKLEERNSELEEEKANSKKEFKNLSDNFSILQKISEDQIQSIQKLKSEVEELRKTESGLKVQLRKVQDSEESYVRRCNGDKQVIGDLEDEVEYLQNKLANLQDDLKKHSCEDFVESTCKKKIIQLEKAVAQQKLAWESSIRNLTSERDKATAAAKKALSKVVELKAECDGNIAEVQSQAKQELLKYQVEGRKELSEKMLRIQTLEVEMDRIRQNSAQTQQSLTQRIHQLQSALNICLGSFTQHQTQQPFFQQSFMPPPSGGISSTMGSTFLG